MMNRWMFDASLYVCHCGLPISIRDKPNAFLENSTTQFVVCQKNYKDPSKCRYFKYMAEDYHLCDCHTQASLRVTKSGIHIGIFFFLLKIYYNLFTHKTMVIITVQPLVRKARTFQQNAPFVSAIIQQTIGDVQLLKIFKPITTVTPKQTLITVSTTTTNSTKITLM
jgi:hypothetical protein